MQPQGLDSLDHRLAIAEGQGLQQAKHIAAIDTAQHQAHAGFLELPRTEGNRLIGQAQRIAHGAACCAGQQAQRLCICLHPFSQQHLLQMFANRLGRHRTQVELQAAGEHRHRNLLRVGGGEHKFQVVWRLLQGLEHGIESRAAEHVHFVDHEHLEAPLHRFVDRLLQQRLYLVNAAV